MTICVGRIVNLKSATEIMATNLGHRASQNLVVPTKANDLRSHEFWVRQATFQFFESMLCVWASVISWADF